MSIKFAFRIRRSHGAPKHRKRWLALPAAVLLSLLALVSGSALAADPIVIDHNCTVLSDIPSEWIEAAKNDVKWHYARLSHGRQIHEGLRRVESGNPLYNAEWYSSGGALPDVPDALCIHTLATDPGGYWDGSGLDQTRSTLDGNPALNVSMFVWCTDLNTASAPFVEEYLQAMSTLEAEYPQVTFVYSTGTAEYDGDYGYNRWLRNEQIRGFCRENGKILYDFADLDSWWYNETDQAWEHSTYTHNGQNVPVEHPELAGNDINHTSYESCVQKGKAAWWLVAALAGWEGAGMDVTFQELEAECISGAVSLRWKVSATGSIEGFNIYRSEGGTEVFDRINGEPLDARETGFFKDGGILPGRTYAYRIGVIEDGNERISHAISITIERQKLRLYQNYPNPFNPVTSITFFLEESVPVTLEIYNAAGQRIRSLIDGERAAGDHQAIWDGKNNGGRPACSGVYFYKLKAGKSSEIKRMILLR